MIDSAARIAGGYCAGILLCLVYGIGVLCGVPLFSASMRAAVVAIGGYFVGRTATVFFLRAVAQTIAESQEKEQETTPDERTASE